MKTVLDERLQEDENTCLSPKSLSANLIKSMAYKIIVWLRAQKEIENSVGYYGAYPSWPR
jgi:hypothetical protein